MAPDGLPVHAAGRVDQANFECEIPKAATASHPASVGVYGHGLFGSADEVTASGVPQYSNAYDAVFCGTDWLGPVIEHAGPRGLGDQQPGRASRCWSTTCSRRS